MTTLNLDTAARIVQNSTILDALAKGISKSDFAVLVHEEYPLMGETEQGVYRMNLIGGLRAMGYTVTGGRKGGDLYQITGFEKPKETAISWSLDQKTTLDWFDNLEPVLDVDNQFYTQAIANRTFGDIRHENNWLYVWSYELTGGRGNRSSGRWYSRDGETAIIKRTFKDKPIFSIIDGNLSPETLAQLIFNLSTVSLKPVKVVNIRWESIAPLMNRLPGWVERVHQSVYDVKQIAETPEAFFSDQSWKTARKMLREIEFVELLYNEPRVPDQTSIIDSWREYREATQARPAITRDYVASELKTYAGKISVLGYWQGKPVSYRVIDSLANRPDVGADILEKSINSSALGGHSGISDASLVNICRLLQSKNFALINGGESLSVGPMLDKYKRKFDRPDLNIASNTFVSKVAHFKP